MDHVFNGTWSTLHKAVVIDDLYVSSNISSSGSNNEIAWDLWRKGRDLSHSNFVGLSPKSIFGDVQLPVGTCALVSNSHQLLKHR